MEEVMAHQTGKDDGYSDFIQSSHHSETDPEVPESSQVQVFVDVHERPKFPDADEPSVEVVQEVEEAQAIGVDEHGVEGGRTADIEPPVIVLTQG